jgi:hypothetical protein
MMTYLDAITIAPQIRVTCSVMRNADRADHRAPASTSLKTIEVEIVAVLRADGEACFVDAFFDPARFDTRAFGPICGDPIFLEALRAELAVLGLPADSLVYAAEDEQDEHCVALEAGPELTRAILARIDSAREDEALAQVA